MFGPLPETKPSQRKRNILCRKIKVGKKQKPVLLRLIKAVSFRTIIKWNRLIDFYFSDKTYNVEIIQRCEIGSSTH